MERVKPQKSNDLDVGNTSRKLNMVTGAFSYAGKYITRRLLSMGENVKTLVRRFDRKHPFECLVEAHPYNFDNPERLAESLHGVDTLYNTYWERFGSFDDFGRVVHNSKILIDSAKKVGVKRIVHISIIGADRDIWLPYFWGKRIVEEYIKESGLCYAILRPTVLFGGDEPKESILINNIAWCLRNFPIFTIPGNGDYRIQPIHVEDLADLAVGLGHADENICIDAAGLEKYTFYNFVCLIKNKIKSKAQIVCLPKYLPLIFSKIISKIVDDILITKDEINGLMRDVLHSRNPPLGRRRLSSWLEENNKLIGTEYASELKRHYRYS